MALLFIIAMLFMELMPRFELGTSSLPRKCAANCATSALRIKVQVLPPRALVVPCRPHHGA